MVRQSAHNEINGVRSMGSESLISAFPERHRLSMPAANVKINDSDPIDPRLRSASGPLLGFGDCAEHEPLPLDADGIAFAI